MPAVYTTSTWAVRSLVQHIHSLSDEKNALRRGCFLKTMAAGRRGFISTWFNTVGGFECSITSKCCKTGLWMDLFRQHFGCKMQMKADIFVRRKRNAVRGQFARPHPHRRTGTEAAWSYFLRLCGGSGEASLVSQLSVVHRHLRGKATQLFGAGDRLRHLANRSSELGRFMFLQLSSRVTVESGDLRENVKRCGISVTDHLLRCDSDGLGELHHRGLVVYKGAFGFWRRSFIHLKRFHESRF